MATAPAWQSSASCFRISCRHAAASGSNSPAWCSASRSGRRPRSRFAFVQLSDPGGTFEVTVFAELLSRSRACLEAGDPLLIEGEVRRRRRRAEGARGVDRAPRRGARQRRRAHSDPHRGSPPRPGGRAASSATCSANTATAAHACAWSCRSSDQEVAIDLGDRSSPRAHPADGSRAPRRRRPGGRFLKRLAELTGLPQSPVAHPEARDRHAVRGSNAHEHARHHPGPAGRRRRASRPRH